MILDHFVLFLYRPSVNVHSCKLRKKDGTKLHHSSAQFLCCLALTKSATTLIFFRHLLLYLSEEEKEIVRQTGYDIIAKLQASMVVTSSVIVAAIMLQNQQGLLFGNLLKLS